MFIARIALTAALVPSMLIGSATVASAAAKPAATLKLVHSHISSGTAPSFTYSTSHLPTGSKVYLQREFGTKHVWKNVKKLSKTSAGAIKTVRAPKLSTLGAYTYRVRVTKHKKVILKGKARTVYVFGKVSFSTLCSTWRTSEGGCDPGAETVGTHVFTYPAAGFGTNYPNYTETAFSVTKTSCRSLTMDYAGTHDPADSNSYIAHARVVQSTADLVETSTSAHTLGHLQAKLDLGGAVQIQFAYEGGADNYMAIAGSADCWTASGVR